jgi:hypothetical protein
MSMNIIQSNLFINSPLENEVYNLNNYFIEMLNNNLMLHFVMLHLTFMLIVMFTSKIIIESKVNLDKIKNLPLPLKVSSFIHSIVVRVVNTWKSGVNYWILTILFFIMLFNSVSVYSFYVLLSLLK